MNAILYSLVVPVPGDDSTDENAPVFDESKDACNDIDLNDDCDDEIITAR